MHWTEDSVKEVALAQSKEADTELSWGALTNRAGLFGKQDYINKPVVTYLFSDEWVQDIITTQSGIALDGRTKGAGELSLKSVHAFTDRRILSISGTEQGDAIYSIPYYRILEVSVSESGFLKSGGFKFHTRNHEYQIPEPVGDSIIELLNTNMGEGLPEVYISPETARKIVCTKCHEQVKLDAERCPNCSHDPEERTSVAAVQNHPVAKCSGYEYVELESVSTKLEWFPSPGGSENRTPETDESAESGDLDRLRELKQLRDEGVISEDEFEEAKSNILDEL